MLAFCVAAQCAHFDTVAVAEPVEITAKKIMGNTRTAHGANRVWRGEPAHVVGAYTLDIQEEEHGLYKTADCGAERCRRKLRGGMPDEQKLHLDYVQRLRAHSVALGSGAA